MGCVRTVESQKSLRMLQQLGKFSRAMMLAIAAFCWTASSAQAQDDLTLNIAPGSESVAPGDTVTVTLNVANLSEAINGVQALMSYDPGVLMLTAITPTDLLGLLPSAEGWVEVFFSDFSGALTYAIVINGDSTVLDGTVATLTFTAIAEGVTTVAFRPDADPLFTKLTASIDNATIPPTTTGSGNITSSCDDGLACTLDTLVGAVCDHTIEPAGVLCRAAIGPCDVPETCDGVSGACPIDGLESLGMVCRAAVDLCDAEEVCNGVSVSCPPDAAEPAAVICRPSIGLCDIEEACDGVSEACPPDGFEPVTTPCSDGTFCNGLETCDGAGICLTASDPCAPLGCDEVNDLCFAPIHVANLEVFYAGRLLDQADPSKDFLAPGSVATTSNITNYAFGITGIRVHFDNLATFATTPDAAFSFRWTTGIGTIFSPIDNPGGNVTVTATDIGGVTIVDVVITDNHVQGRWLELTIDANQITSSGIALDGELFGNPVFLPSGEGNAGGNSIFYVGNMMGDVTGDRADTLSDVGQIRLRSNPALVVPIDNIYDIDKSGKIQLTDVGLARLSVSPAFVLPLISP